MSPLTAPRILVVDDEPDILDSLAPTLQRSLGVEVETAHSGEEAQRRLRQEDYTMVITDQRMPGLKGTELLTWLRQEHPDTVRVLMSAFHESFFGPEAAQAQADLFLRKPFRVDSMVEAVRDALVPSPGRRGMPGAR